MHRYEVLEHIGLHANRIELNLQEIPLHRNSYEEMAYAQQWARENEQEWPHLPVLASLLGRNATQEEAILAATVIQWLGSNIGRCFLRGVQIKTDELYDAGLKDTQMKLFNLHTDPHPKTPQPKPEEQKPTSGFGGQTLMPGPTPVLLQTATHQPTQAK